MPAPELAPPVGVVAIGWPELHRAVQENKLAEDAGVLVIVTLYGGNDGISTVIPYTDNAYYDARHELAYAPEEVLPLDAQLGLNPTLQGFSQLWTAQKLAIIRGVSYPKPDRSHFRSMDIWQTASPSEPVRSGWIGRWLDATGDDPVRAINVGAVLPVMAVGEKQTASALSDDTWPVPSQFAETLALWAQPIPRTMRRCRPSVTPIGRPGSSVRPLLRCSEVANPP